MTSTYNSGMMANMSGIPIEENPHKSGSKNHSSWNAGWHHSEKHSNENERLFSLSKDEIEFLHFLVKKHGPEYFKNLKLFDDALLSLRKKLRLWEAEFVARN